MSCLIPRPFRDISESYLYIKQGSDYLAMIPEEKRAAKAKLLFHDSDLAAQDMMGAALRVMVAALGALLFYDVGIDLISLGLVAIISLPAAAILGGSTLCFVGLKGVMAVSSSSFLALGASLARLAAGWVILEHYNVGTGNKRIGFGERLLHDWRGGLSRSIVTKLSP